MFMGSCAKEKGERPPAPRVVILTSSESISPGEFRGAEAFVSDYADRASPSSIEAVHLLLPDKPKAGRESAITARIIEASGDPHVKAIVVDPALPGTAEGFRRAKEARPDLVCIAGESSEDDLVIEASSDLVVDLDRVYRAYILAWAAKKMSAQAIIAVYSFEESSAPESARERAIMSHTAADLGLRYIAMTAPEGVDAAAFVRARSGAWLRDYGPNATLYCSSESLVQPILAGAIAGGGIVVDAAGSATRAAYAQALGLDLSPAKGDAGKELKLLEAAVVSAGLRGRLGLWEAPYAEASVEGLGEFAMRVVLGTARKGELKDLLAALDARARGAAWIAAYDMDPASGVRSGNRILLRQDVYVLGSGYLQSALQTVPMKYLLIDTASD
jgi:hypothetical protein